MARTFTCSCQYQVGAPDVDGLVGPVKAHFDEAHPDLGINEVSVRNYLEAEVRLSPEKERLSDIGEVRVVPIRPERMEEIAEFMDHRAYADYPAWAGCYCMYFFLGGHGNPAWGDRYWEDNRRDMLDRVASGRVTGSLAFVDGRLVGWCNATGRGEFPSLATGDDDGIGSVVCFLIAPPYRGHGLAARLLEGALAELKSLGYASAEAYPSGATAPWERAFTGTLDLYLEAGFEVTKEDPLTVGISLA
jgi:GNAT superfamily N-acetyltransferase